MKGSDYQTIAATSPNLTLPRVSPSSLRPVSESPRPRVSPLSFSRSVHLRILLWDIDGTLIRSARTGAFKDYTIPMLEGVFGTSGRTRRDAGLRYD